MPDRTRTPITALCTAALLTAALAPAASAQLATTKIIQEGDAFAGGIVDVLRASGDTNALGTFAFQLDTENQAFIAAFDGSALTTLVAASGSDAIDAEIGLGDTGDVAYSGNFNGLGGVRLNDTVILEEGTDAAFGATNFLEVRNTGSNQVTFAGLQESTGFYLNGFLEFPVVGDRFMLDGEEVRVLRLDVQDHDYDPTQGFLVEASVEDNFGAVFDVVLLNGQPLTLPGGGIAAEDRDVPGLTGETFDAFDNFELNAAGDVLLSGDTSAPTSADEFLLVNGEVLAQEAGTLAGLTLDSGISGVDLNENGDFAVLWDTDERDEVVLIGSVAAGIYAVPLIEGDTITVDGVSAVFDGHDRGGIRISEADSAGVFDVYVLGNINGTSDDIWLTFSIPEPTTAGLLGVGLAAAALRRRRA